MRRDKQRFEQFLKEAKEYHKLIYGEDYNPIVEYYEFKRYLTDIKGINDILHNEFNKNQKFLVVAPTDSGKTYTLIKNYMKETSGEVYFFTVPNKSQSEQIESSYSDVGVISIVGEKNRLKDFDLNKNKFFSIVYDKMNEIEDILDIYPNLKFNIVLDESHNLESSVGYRPAAIQNLDRVCDLILAKGGSVCLMTASYESMKYERVNKIINFITEEDYKAHTDNFNLYVNKCFDKDKDFNVFVYNILKNITGIVRYNSKKSTELLESALKNKDNLKVYHTNGDERKYKKVDGKMIFENIIDDSIINHSKLPENDIVFTTCKFDCGTNISNIEGIDNYEYAASFLINGSRDLNLMNIEQFFNRLRFHNKEYNLFLNYERPEKDFRTLNEIAEKEKEIVDRNIKYLELLLGALEFKYNDNKNKIIEEFNYQLDFIDEDGTKNDLGCIYLSDNLEVKCDRKSFFNKCNNKYQQQYYYHQDKLIEKLEEIFNIEIKVQNLKDENIEYIDLEAYKEANEKEVLKTILNDEELLNEIKTNEIKSDIIKNIYKKDIYKKGILGLYNLGYETEEAFDFVINNSEEVVEEKKKELIKNIELTNIDIISLRKVANNEITLNELRDIETVNYKKICSIVKSDYFEYIKKSVKMKIDIKDIWEVIKTSEKDAEIIRYFTDYQIIYYNKLFLEDEKLLGGKTGKEQKVIIKCFTDEYNKIRRLKISDEKIEEVCQKLNKEFKVNTYKKTKVKRMILKIFNINKDNQTTSLRLK